PAGSSGLTGAPERHSSVIADRALLSSVALAQFSEAPGSNASIRSAASRNSNPRNCLTSSTPPPWPQWLQIHEPEPPVSMNLHLSLPPHIGHGPFLPVRKLSAMPNPDRTERHFP